jgi:hypothetical protein
MRSGTVLLLFLCFDGIARVLFEALRFEPVRMNAWVGLVAALVAAALLARYRAADREGRELATRG